MTPIRSSPSRWLWGLLAAVVAGFVPALTGALGAATGNAWWHPAVVLSAMSIITFVASLVAIRIRVDRDDADALESVGRLANDREARNAAEQRCHAAPEQRVVVDHHQPQPGAQAATAWSNAPAWA